MAEEELLLHVLTEIRRRGGIGTQSVTDAVAHADRFVAAVPPGCTAGADLGSGGGLPSLVLAARRREMEWHLVERRATRADLLRFAVRTLGLDDRVVVHVQDVHRFARHPPRVDVVTARSFGTLAVTLRAASSVLHGCPDRDAPGWALVSEPPTGLILDSAEVERLGLRDAGSLHGIHLFSTFHVEHPPGRRA